MIFSRIARVEPHSGCQPGSRTVSNTTVNMNEDDLVIANRLAQKPPVNGISEDFDWDDVLNWGLRYNNYVVFTKISRSLKMACQTMENSMFDQS